MIHGLRSGIFGEDSRAFDLAFPEAIEEYELPKNFDPSDIDGVGDRPCLAGTAALSIHRSVSLLPEVLKAGNVYPLVSIGFYVRIEGKATIPRRATRPKPSNAEGEF